MVLRPSFSMVLPAFVWSVFIAASAWSQEALSTISITGDARLRLRIDEIVIYGSIETKAKSVAAACKDNHEKSRSLIEYLTSKNIDTKLIETDLLTISEIRSIQSSKASRQSTSDQNAESDRQAATGYSVSRNLTIVVRETTKFEEIHQGIMEKGLCVILEIKCRSSKEKEESEKLRQVAARVAKERAYALARELGANLLAIKSISNSKVYSTGDSIRGVRSGRGMGMGGFGGSGGYSDDPFGTPDETPFEKPSEPSISHVTLVSSVDVVFTLGAKEQDTSSN